eukprot:CAMPEP_0197574932 /NCGR_PEP_ID=MMETSP1326-20131121/505_1 /TAXON_ID=1155430 /ORGANISM="Genus nov. species nov., Strain RCC2288" /LENGTH=623 /DNA_ID=CAMNT_0043137603 /DNA_START=78 /DNA_END=1952 /DNA_ORIENTATION=+
MTSEAAVDVVSVSVPTEESEEKSMVADESEVQAFVSLGKGIAKDFRNRWPLYGDDWRQGFGAGVHIFAPATYIFFASVLPALTFGEQFRVQTEGQFSIPHIICATAMGGFIQSILGGQPLLIVGIAGPVVMLYQYLFNYCKEAEDLGVELFRPFCSWVLIITGGLHFVIAFVNASEYVHSFTRFAGETFGSLIGILFFQAAVKGLQLEFEAPAEASLAYRQVNGVWSIFLALAYVMLTVWLMQARSWHVANPAVRAVVADYGATIAVVFITVLSYAVRAPSGVDWQLPMRVSCKQVYDPEVTESWNTISKLGQVPASQIGVAIIPAVILTTLFFFDHNVSSQLAQTEEFKLKKPPAYHWDFALVGLITLLMGLLGMPPPNGAIPQSPMHTRCLQGVGQKLEPNSTGEGAPGAPKRGEVVLENRLSNFIQSLLVGLCMFLSPVIRLMPRAVLWGYFIFMAVQSFPGNQFIHRVTLFVMDVKSLRAGESQPAYVELVPMSDTLKFTAMQLGVLLVVYAVTWAGIYGISFPLLIMLLVPFRQYVLVRLFPASSLIHLDCAPDVELKVEADMENADHQSDEWSGGSFSLGGSGAFVQHKTLVTESEARRLSMERRMSMERKNKAATP